MKVTINPPKLTPEQEAAISKVLADTVQQTLDDIAAGLLRRAYNRPPVRFDFEMKPSIRVEKPEFNILLGDIRLKAITVPIDPPASELELDGDYAVMDE